MRTSYDAIVLGVGGMGSSASYHLAKRGVDVLGIERYDIPHTRGSSHGDTRIFRLTQPEHPKYVPLAQRAQTLWKELETESNKELLTVTGSVHAGPGDGKKITDAVKSCDVNDISYEILTGAEINERFPGYNLPVDYKAIYQSDGGFLACERAIVTHVNQCHAHGGTIHARERVLNWKPHKDRIQVRTDRSTYETDHLVVTAGAWTAANLDSLSDALTPQRRTMAWLQPEKPAHFTPEKFPVFDVDVPEGSFYGFPIGERPGFKFGRSPRFAETIDPDSWQNKPTLQDEKLLRQLPENHFSDAAGPTMSLATCIVTNSLDGHFYLDTYSEDPHISLAAGFTGHGFKFSSAVGEILSDFVINGDTDNEIDLHRLNGRLS